MTSQSSRTSLAAKIREIGVHSVIYGFGSIAQSAVQFVLIPVLTATLAAGEFGAYSLLQMASVIASAIFYFGMTSALPRSYFDYEDEGDRRSVFTTAFILLLIGAFAQIALGEVGGRWISRLLLRTDRYEVEVFWALFSGAVSFINVFFFAYLRFLRRSVASIVLSIVALTGSIGVSLFLLHLNGHDLTAPFKGTAYAQCVVAVIFVVIYGRAAFTPALNTNEIQILLHFGLPAVLVSIAGIAIDWADRIFIERMLSIRDVGVYSVGYKLGSVVNTLVITPFTQIWNPMMIEYRFHANIKDFFARIVSYYFLASSLILVAACFFIRDVLPYVARSVEYASAAPVILLVLTGYLVNGSGNIVAAGLIYERRIVRLAVLYYAIAITKIGLNLFLIPRLGLIGAALSTLVMYILMPVAIYWQARRYFSITFETGRLVRIGIIVAACLFFGLFIDGRIAISIGTKLITFMICVALFVIFCTDKGEKRRVLLAFEKRASGS